MKKYEIYEIEEILKALLQKYSYAGIIETLALIAETDEENLKGHKADVAEVIYNASYDVRTALYD